MALRRSTRSVRLRRRARAPRCPPSRSGFRTPQAALPPPEAAPGDVVLIPTLPPVVNNEPTVFELNLKLAVVVTNNVPIIPVLIIEFVTVSFDKIELVIVVLVVLMFVNNVLVDVMFVKIEFELLKFVLIIFVLFNVPILVFVDTRLVVVIFVPVNVPNVWYVTRKLVVVVFELVTLVANKFVFVILVEYI